jgi:hypothetical protein
MSNLFKMPLSPKDDMSHHGKFNGFREDGELDGISGYGPASQDAKEPSHAVKVRMKSDFPNKLPVKMRNPNMM